MIRIMRADLRRILRTKGLHIFNVFLVLFMPIFLLSEDKQTTLDKADSFLSMGGILLVSLLAIIKVYSDELHAGTIQGAIGAGIKRDSVVAAKFLSCAVIGIFELGFILLLMFGVMALDDSILFTKNDHLMLVYSCICHYVVFLDCIALSSLVLYASWSVPAAFITDVAVVLLLPAVFSGVDSLLNTVFTELWVKGLVEVAYVSLCNGAFDARLIIAVLVYVILPAYLSAAVFRRKELEL